MLSRGTFAAAIFLTDVAFIVAMSCLTGIAYHLATYGKPGNIILFMQVGVLAASQAAHRAIQVWNVTLICLLMVGGSGSLRGEANATMSASECSDDNELTYCFSMARTYLSALDLQRPDRPRDDHSRLSLTTPLPLSVGGCAAARRPLCC